MRLIDSLESLDLSDSPSPRVLTAGVFDGVHLAHQRLVHLTLRAAHRKEPGGTAIVLTFANHPLSVLAPAYVPKKLLSAQRKAVLLDRMGVDVLVMPEFTLAVAAMTPERFVEEILVRKCRINHLVVGFDYRFGASGTGDTRFLSEAGRLQRFQVEVAAAVTHEEWTVSSTRIRELIEEGRVHLAAEMLGRPYELSGPTVRGYGRGTQLGFPTANLVFDPSFAIPASGVYAVFVLVENPQPPVLSTQHSALGTQHSLLCGGMMNIGSSPTFAGTEYRPEVFLFDYEGEELYGRELRVYFIERLREERKFPSAAALRERLGVDETMARAVLESKGGIDLAL